MIPDSLDRREALKWLGAAAGVAGIGTTTTAIAQSDADDEETGDEEEEDEEGDAGATGDVAAVTFDSQTVPADEEEVEVVVERAVLPEGGYVVIHNELLLTEDDAVGSVVGVSDYYEPGVFTDIEVEVFADGIVDADEDGAQTLVAMPHTEDDDSEDDPVYEFPNDDDDEETDDAPYVDSEDTNGDGVEVVIDLAQITFVYDDEKEDDEEEDYEDEDYGGKHDEEEDDGYDDEEREYEEDEEDEYDDEEEEDEYDDEEEEDDS